MSQGLLTPRTSGVDHPRQIRAGGWSQPSSLPNSVSGIFWKHEKFGQMLIAAALAAAVGYYGILFFLFDPGNEILFYLLISSEVFHLWQITTFCHTVWRTKQPEFPFDPAYAPPVDVFITVAGEPVDLVRKTIEGAQAIDYPNFAIYVLNDGLVAGKPNWKEIEILCEELGIRCLTRRVPGGAKAGNINHALSKSSGEYVAIFDADHVPYTPFLKKTMGYFVDQRVGFVQTPQYYKNHALNHVTAGAWEQQVLFFGAICNGKNSLNSAFMCGTNLVFRRKAVVEVGGIFEKNISEDFLTSMFLHEQGWQSVYVPEILAEGLAPEDLQTYAKQQFRWARGALEVVFRFNPFFRKGLNFAQKIQYLASASQWLSGLCLAINACFPLIFFFWGLMPLATVNETVMLAFLPFILMTMLLIREMSNSQFRFQGICFCLGAFPVHIKALIHLLCGFKSRFEVTNKRRQSAHCWLLVLPLAGYIVCALAGILVCFGRHGLSAALVANAAWGLFYAAIFTPLLVGAWEKPSSQALDPLPQKQIKNQPEEVVPPNLLVKE